MELSIIIPSFLDCDDLSNTLGSFPVLPKNVEIIVVNDGADRAISDVCKRFEVNEISVERNVGSYGARNIGIAQARGAVLGFIDSGVTVSPDWIERAIAGAGSADYIGGPVIHPWPCEERIVELAQAIYSFPVKRYFDKSGYAPTANLVVRRSVFEDIGLFDSRLRSGGDLEFGQRVRSSKRYLQRFDSERTVYHSYRTISGLKKKQCRVTMGIRYLEKLHPERYGGFKRVAPRMLKILLPPRQFPASNLNIQGADKVLVLSWLTRWRIYILWYSVRLSGVTARYGKIRNPNSYEYPQPNENLAPI